MIELPAVEKLPAISIAVRIASCQQINFQRAQFSGQECEEITN